MQMISGTIARYVFTWILKLSLRKMIFHAINAFSKMSLTMSVVDNYVDVFQTQIIIMDVSWKHIYLLYILW